MGCYRVGKSPEKCIGMIEKVTIGDALYTLNTVKSVNHLIGLAGNEGRKITPLNLLNSTRNSEGIIIDTNKITCGKWYRIAIGTASNDINSALLNIANSYWNIVPYSQLLYISYSGYSDIIVNQIAKQGVVIDKIRILAKADPSTKSMIDVHIKEYRENTVTGIRLSYACNMGITFQLPEEIPDTPEEGYTSKEFVLS